ncbi:MAG: hypothetical protein GTN88_04280, partial [Gammaproteobacteria bacterium]|nr:hypothetical protein [Gammaproteobacteria bacterium]NIQ25776.1 hypothetical protein [Gammaproteobacteria bacterium]
MVLAGAAHAVMTACPPVEPGMGAVALPVQARIDTIALAVEARIDA